MRLSLETGGKKVGTTVAWEDVARAAAEASTRDFDNLLLADKDGVVVWQREKATPRVDDLLALLNTETEPAGWFSLDWQVLPTRKKAQAVSLPANASMSPVDVGGGPSYLFVQPVSLPKDGAVQLPTLYVGGLLSRRALDRQATHIPVVWMVVVTLPVILVFLALPFIKLATLMPKERYAFADVALLGLATICAAGIGASVPFGPAGVTAQGDQRLATAANAMEKKAWRWNHDDLARTIRGGGEMLKAGFDGAEADHRKGACPPKRWWLNALRNMKTQLATGAAEQDLDEILGSLDLDIVAWVNRDGQQVQKWTTKTVVTDFDLPPSVRSLPQSQPGSHVDAGRGWPTTRPVVAVPRYRSVAQSDDGGNGLHLRCARDGRERAETVFCAEREAAVGRRIRSCLPVTGSPCSRRMGECNCHSEEALSLKENFLEEVNNPGEVRTWLQSGHQVTWSGDYHGRPHHLHMRSMPAFAGCQWRIVAFREMEPVLAAQFGQQTGMFRLWFLGFYASGSAGTHLVVYARLVAQGERHHADSGLAQPSRHERARRLGRADGLPHRVDLPRRRHSMARLSRSSGSRSPRSSPLPSRLSRAAGSRASSARSAPVGAIVEVLLLLLLIGVLPSVGFARIANRLQDASDTTAWLETAASRWGTRRVRVLE